LPPKADPYATARARAVDLALILFALLVIALVLRAAPRHRSDIRPTPRAAHQSDAVLLASSDSSR